MLNDLLDFIKVHEIHNEEVNAITVNKEYGLKILRALHMPDIDDLKCQIYGVSVRYKKGQVYKFALDE